MLMRVLHFVTAAVVRAAGDFDSKGSPGFQGRLLVMDGSSVTLPDSNANRRQYSYPSGQKPGLGFPKMYLLGLFDLRSGASLRVVKSNTLRHDSALAWRLIGALRAGDILLADRAFCSYAFIVACQARGVFVLMRLHQSRKSDNGKGRALGAGDEIQTWAKPKTCPKDFSDSRFNALPASLDIRVVAQQVEVRGHRPETLYLATTLCNPQVHGAQAIAALYLRRWEVELMFDDLKTSQSMETLRCESPHMLARELLMHLIASDILTCRERR